MENQLLKQWRRRESKAPSTTSLDVPSRPSTDLDHAIPTTCVPTDRDPTSLDVSPPPVPCSTVTRLAELAISCIGKCEFQAAREILRALIRIETLTAAEAGAARAERAAGGCEGEGR